jgi:hypothetical protein
MAKLMTFSQIKSKFFFFFLNDVVSWQGKVDNYGSSRLDMRTGALFLRQHADISK